MARPISAESKSEASRLAHGVAIISGCNNAAKKIVKKLQK
jgi:hypothetical protein